MCVEIPETAVHECTMETGAPKHGNIAAMAKGEALYHVALWDGVDANHSSSPLTFLRLRRLAHAHQLRAKMEDVPGRGCPGSSFF